MRHLHFVLSTLLLIASHSALAGGGDNDPDYRSEVALQCDSTRVEFAQLGEDDLPSDIARQSLIKSEVERVGRFKMTIYAYVWEEDKLADPDVLQEASITSLSYHLYPEQNSRRNPKTGAFEFVGTTSYFVPKQGKHYIEISRAGFNAPAVMYLYSYQSDKLLVAAEFTCKDTLLTRQGP